jgi:hypothetical protein
LVEPRRRDVIHAVLQGAVGAHIVDHSLRSNYNPVAALLDALDVIAQRMLCQDLTLALDQLRLPETPQVRSIGMQRLRATGQDRRRHPRLPATLGSVCDGDVVRCEHSRTSNH